MLSGSRQADGFAYVLLLVALAIVGVMSSAAVNVGVATTRRSAEQELLNIGREYERALMSYRAATPAGDYEKYPKSLNDLVKDPRFPGVKRHLRRVYPDPLTGQERWGLICDAKGSVYGIYSLSKGVPLKRAGFEPNWKSFVDASKYSEWIFGLGSDFASYATATVTSIVEKNIIFRYAEGMQCK